MRTQRWNKLKVDSIKINWKHNHWSIKCRADWAGASVWEFPGEIALDGNIIAYTIGDAMSVLEEIKTQREKEENDN